MPHNIAILGSTGSIGTQTLDVISHFPDRFKATVLTAGSKVDELIEQARIHRPALAIIADESKYARLHEALSPLGIETASGAAAIADAMERDDFDTVVTATVGYSGLLPTVRAIRTGKEIALANKETGQPPSRRIKVKSDTRRLGTLGDLPVSGRRGKRLGQQTYHHRFGRSVPHNGQQAHSPDDRPRGPAAPALADGSQDHYRLNKAFEIIEARWLFDIEPERIEAVVHPQSIIHSMVEFIDGAVKAQLGIPDMRLPIRYALGDASRLPSSERPLSLADYSTLTFEKPDAEKFPCLTLAPYALSRGGNTACIINAANEVAVRAFLDGRISFPAIYSCITQALEAIDFIAYPSLDDYVATHHATIKFTEENLTRK